MGRWSQPISLIHLEGTDARRFLHGQSSQAIELAPAGSCLPTCLISPTGRMRALALVLPNDGGADLLVLAGDAAAVHANLDRVLFPADRVRLGEPQAAQLVRWIGHPHPTDNSAGLLKPGVDLGAGAGLPALLLRLGDTMPAWLAELPELTAEQVEQLRLQQGFPSGPGELNDSTNPFELGLCDWVSLNKGCYVGQETLAKLATYDGVKQQLRYWRTPLAGPSVAAGCSPGTNLLTPAGERAGVISSMLATENGLEGLALVRRAALEQQELLVANGGGVPISLTLHVPKGFVSPPVRGS